VDVRVDVRVGVRVGVRVAVAVRVGVRVAVGVCVSVCVGVWVGVAVGVALGVTMLSIVISVSSGFQDEFIKKVVASNDGVTEDDVKKVLKDYIAKGYIKRLPDGQLEFAVDDGEDEDCDGQGGLRRVRWRWPPSSRAWASALVWPFTKGWLLPTSCTSRARG
jgi:hypothetical protein